MDELTGSTGPAAGANVLSPAPSYADCVSCGRSITDSAGFCPYCGKPQAVPSWKAPAEGHVPWTPLDMGKAIGFIIVGVLVSAIPLAVAVVLFVGSDRDESDATYLTINLGWSAVLQFLMLYSVIRFGIGKYHAPRSTLGLRRPRAGGYWLPVPLVFGAYGIVVIYSEVLAAFGVSPDTDLPEGTFDNPGPIIAIAILSLVLAPIIEEIFFRGYIFGGLRTRWGFVLGALGSGCLFGLVHAANPGAFYLVPAISMIGVLFAWAYFYSGSLFASIGAHFLFNLTSFIVGLTTQ